MLTKRIKKAVVIASCLAFSILLLSVRSADSSYHVSMYQQLPSGVLYVSMGVLFVSVLVAIHSVYRDEFVHGSNFTVLLYLSGVLLLPSLLGYVVKYGDPIIKVGNIKDMPTGRVFDIGLTGLNKYPHFHTEMSMLSSVTGMGVPEILGFIGVFMLLVYTLSIVSISKYYSVSFGPVLLLIPLIYHSTMRPIRPSSMALLTVFPVCLLAYHRLLGPTRRFGSWAFLFAVLGLALWTQHLFIASLLLLVVIGREAMEYTPVLTGVGSIRTSVDGAPTRLVAVLTLGCFGVFWLMYGPANLLAKASLTVAQVVGLYRVRAQYNPVPGAGPEYLLAGLGFTVFDIIALAFKRFGGYLILLSISGLGALGYLYSLVNEYRLRGEATKNYVILLIFTVGAVWSLAELVVGIVPAIHWIRVLRVSAVVSPVLGGWLIQRLTDSSFSTPSVRTCLVSLFSVYLLFGLFLTMGGVYGTPWSVSANSYTVDSSVEGWDWYFDHTDYSATTVNLGSQSRRYAELTMSPSEEAEWAKTSERAEYASPHFESLGKCTGNTETYYTSNERNRILNTEIGFTENFGEDDIEHIRYYSSEVDLVYDNRQMYVGHVC